MDVSIWVGLTAIEWCEKGAACRELVEPSLDDPRTKLCVIGRCA